MDEKKNKKPFGETAFGKFLNKAKEVVPEVGDVALKLVTGNVGGAVEEVGNIIKKKAETDAKAKDLMYEFEREKMQFEIDLKSLEVEDRKNARDLFKVDGLIQKIFAICFLVGYAFLSWYLLEIIKGEVKQNDLFKTMVTMIWTGTSTKLGTIVDFFFGGSMDKEK